MEPNKQLVFEFGAEPKPSPPAAPIPLPPEPVASPTVDRAVVLRKGEALRQELVRRSGLQVFLTLTNNRSRLASFKTDPRTHSVHMRLHMMFLDAPPEVVRTLAHWLKHPKARSVDEVLREFFREHRDKVAPPRKRRIAVVTKGLHFDLAELLAEVNQAHFDGKVACRITWGNLPVIQGRRRSIRFGSYTEEENLVRIHPLLDQEFVPRFFVRYIVFHEMLHAFVGISRTPTGRRQVHSGVFKRLEISYPDYEQAVAWQAVKKNLKRLLNPSKFRL